MDDKKIEKVADSLISAATKIQDNTDGINFKLNCAAGVFILGTVLNIAAIGEKSPEQDVECEVDFGAATQIQAKQLNQCTNNAVKTLTAAGYEDASVEQLRVTLKDMPEPG